jgi:hypothetical protein
LATGVGEGGREEGEGGEEEGGKEGRGGRLSQVELVCQQRSQRPPNGRNDLQLCRRLLSLSNT